MSVRLVIKALRASGQPAVEFPVDIDRSATVEELKEQIAGRVELPKENIRLVCAGRIWENNLSVGSYGSEDGAVVHCLNNPARAAPAATEQTLQAVDPMQSMLGFGGGFGAPPAAGGDPMSQMMAQAQRQLTQNPELMQQILSSPMVQQMMSNPDTIRAMARMNPQLNQLMEQRPEIARLLEDPEMLQQSVRMMSNPSLMREMTRNADRAIGQLDALPGGQAALRRAHEEFADPLFDAITGRSDGSGGTAVVSYSQSTEGMPNNEALPNPWGPPPSATAPATAAAPTVPAAAPVAPAMGQAGMPMMNPFAFMGGAGAGGATGAAAAPAAGLGAPGVNPMANMMQGMGNPMFNMMQNPAQMMQMMQAAQQFRQMMGAGAAPAAPFAAFPGAGLGGGFGPFGAQAPAAQAAPEGGAPAAPMTEMMLNAQRLRFASQLQQLAAMGFTNETVALQALVRNNGRVDAALDTLLSSPDTGGESPPAPTSE